VRISPKDGSLLKRSIPGAFDAMAQRADQAEALAEDLKIQLDDALGAEDMLEQLSDRNLALSEASGSTRRQPTAMLRHRVLRKWKRCTLPLQIWKR